jgi:hypothetical protein
MALFICDYDCLSLAHSNYVANLTNGLPLVSQLNILLYLSHYY